MAFGKIGGIVVTLIGGLLLNFGVRFYNRRRLLKGLPQPPHSFLWGHLKVMGEASNELPPNCHPQVFLTSIAQKHNLKGIFYLDLWPVTGSMVVVNEPDLMNYISVTKSLPMHPMSEDFMTPIVGPHNIASTNGPVWKKLHNILAPAFSWSHIRNLSSVVLDETTTFRSSLDSLAESGNTFSMHETASHFIFDIIARVVYNFSLNAQRSGSQDLDDLKSLVHISQVQMGWNPIEKIKTMFLKKSLFRRIDKSVETMVKQRLEALSNDQIVPSKKNPNSILDLMLREHLEQNTSHTKGVKVTELPQEDMKLFTTNIKALLLGGQGTTADTLCYIYMLLSKSPKVLAKLREEHTRVFHSSFDETLEMIQAKPSKLDELDYTTAVIRETLRLFPVGFGVRKAANDAKITYNSRDYPIGNDLVVIGNAHSLHFDPKYYPSPSIFDPERFLDPATAADAKANMRTFNRGPRACMGQNLAVDELRLILLMTVRDYEFELVGLKPNEKPRVPWWDLDTTFGDIAFQELRMSAEVRGGMMMKVKRVEGR